MCEALRLAQDCLSHRIDAVHVLFRQRKVEIDIFLHPVRLGRSWYDSLHTVAAARVAHTKIANHVAMPSDACKSGHGATKNCIVAEANNAQTASTLSAA